MMLSGTDLVEVNGMQCREGEGSRFLGLRLDRPALFQLSYAPICLSFVSRHRMMALSDASLVEANDMWHLGMAGDDPATSIFSGWHSTS